MVREAVQPVFITLHVFHRLSLQVHNADPTTDQVASGSLSVLPLAFESMGVRNVIRIHSGHPFGLGFRCRAVGRCGNSLVGSFQDTETRIPDGLKFLKGSIARSVVGNNDFNLFEMSVQDGVNSGQNGGFSVVNRKDDRDFW